MSGQNPVTPDAEGIAAAAKAAGKGKGLPPVHLWNPPFCGDLDIRIARDGSWHYLGTPFTRFELVKLFASILILENGKYFLVTPVEKVGITVEDAPFVAVDFDVAGQGRDQVITFTTNVGDTTAAGAMHPIRVERDSSTGEPSPYVMVRAGLEARIDRKSFYRLAELGEHHQDWFGVWSAGEFFPLIASAELDAG
ncbi:proteophosphoglycan precursor [Rhodobacteraceae bacterium (ex Bugula neritina AB1)]|nr:proteophosphoglycan precursor [Rhodobacteraceae bacterium (ex Bugula neritina AB1)]